MEIEYPKNIHEWFSDGRDKEFSLWAFGCEQPVVNGGIEKCWNENHPEYPMKEGDTIYLCVCKMNYIFQKLKERLKDASDGN